MGGGGLRKYLENGKSGGVGGSYVEFPPWWGYGYFLEPHNVQRYLAVTQLSFKLCPPVEPYLLTVQSFTSYMVLPCLIRGTCLP